MHGWAGRILRVDLTNSEVTQISTQPYAEKYLGGRGIASRLYWETVGPEVKAFDPENRLIFMTGTLVATGSQGATRMSVVGKSPMTYPEGFCFGNMGGFFGAEIKKAGFDGIIIEGRAPKPVYLWIHDDRVEIRDASSLWGKGAYQTGEMIQQLHGDKARFVTTGVAGENLVRTAILFASHQSTSEGGFGAVLGSKNLKAIVVVGTGKPSLADPDEVKQLSLYTIEISKGRYCSGMPKVLATKHDHLVKKLSKGRCYQCGMECFRGLYRYGDRLEGQRRCQAQEYYLPWMYSREDEPIETFFNAPTLANDYSISTWELQSIVDWLYACHQSGSLDEKDTGLPLSRIGSGEFIEKLIRSIAYREGFGEILAEGLVRASEKLSNSARAKLSPLIAPIGKNDLVPARAYLAHALLYPMEPRVHQAIIHEIGTVTRAWAHHRQDPSSSPVTIEVYHKISRAFWGSDEAGDMSTYEGKVLAAKKIQNRTYTKDSLGLCDPAWPITYSLNTQDNVGDPNLEAKIFEAVTGVAGEKVDRAADRIADLQRAILVREGRKLPEADFPLDFNFTEPLGLNPFGHKMVVPGPGEEAIDVTGRTLDRDKFVGMLREYYRLRGWDEATGLPPRVPD